MPHIILEGIDKSGKSTLARYLSDKLNMPIRKFSAPKGDPYKEYLSFIKSGERPQILDRFCIGELVYGPIMRGRSGLSKAQQTEIENECIKQKTVNIYTYNDPAVIKERFKKEGETFVKPEQVEEILKKYEEVVIGSKLSWIGYVGNSEKDLEGVLKDILKKINNE